MPKHFLAACALHRLESMRLREWIEYHLLVGFEHLYLFDNNEPDDGSGAVVAPYVQRGVVTSYQVRGMYPGMQMRLYERLARQQLSTWLAMIDLDEFILPVQCDDVRTVLEEFKRYTGLAMSWRCFGSGGHVAAPPFVIESFTHASLPEWENNRHVKLIARPDRIISMDNPHSCTPLPGTMVVNERHEPVHGGFAPFSDTKIVVNHYMIRSVEDFRLKATRGRGDGMGNPYDDKYFAWADRNEVQETRIAGRFGPEVRRRCLAAGGASGLSSAAPSAS